MTQSTIIVAGDLCLRGRAQSLSSSELQPLLQDVKPILKSVDASLVNMETAVLRNAMASIPKSGPAIAADKRILDFICEGGFSGVTLANNHFADYGSDGVNDSLQLLDEYNLWHVGAGMNADKAAEIKYLQLDKNKVAIINACEHEFTIATDNQAGCNALNPIHQYRAIQEAKLKADFVMVIIHGGVEHYQLPTPRMQETYRFFIDAGADAVVNHHQHCYSGYEIYQGKPIVYGLGNFFFDWPGMDSNWNKGYMVQLEFGEAINMQLIPYIQNTQEIGVRLMTKAEKEGFEKKIAELNAIIADPKQLNEHLNEWAKIRKEEYMRIVRPSKGKRIAQLERMLIITEKNIDDWMPEYLNEDRQLLLKSLFQCESHQEIMNILLQ